MPFLTIPDGRIHFPVWVSADLARAPEVQVLAPWKGIALRESAMLRVRDFLIAHEPVSAGAHR